MHTRGLVIPQPCRLLALCQPFVTDICNQLDAINLSSENPEENWTVFHKTVHSSAATTLGHPSRKHQDWFDETDDEIQRLLEEKHRSTSRGI